MIYHVLNRANGRLPLFETPADYEAFEKVLGEGHDRFPMRILAYCLMPNHWHLVLWPRRDEELSRFMAWVTLTHTQRWHAHRQSAGAGHLYQGRFKSFPVQADEHFLSVCRYVERNALRAAMQTATRELQSLLDTGRVTATYLRKAVRYRYGRDSERLVQFGIRPARKRSRRKKAAPGQE